MALPTLMISSARTRCARLLAVRGVRPDVCEDAYDGGRRCERRWFRHTSMSLIVGGLIVALFLFTAVAAPVVTSFAPDQVRAGPRLAPPSQTHPFGTDTLGRDMFSRVLFGAAIAVRAAVVGMGIAALLGIPPGLLAGYRGGWLDRLLSRLIDVWLAFPGLLLALVVVARLGPTLTNAIIAVGLLGAPGDLFDGGTPEAGLGKDDARCAQDVLSAPFAILFAPLPGGHGLPSTCRCECQTTSVDAIASRACVAHAHVRCARLVGGGVQEGRRVTDRRSVTDW